MGKNQVCALILPLANYYIFLPVDLNPIFHADAVDKNRLFKNNF